MSTLRKRNLAPNNASVPRKRGGIGLNGWGLSRARVDNDASTIGVDVCLAQDLTVSDALVRLGRICVSSRTESSGATPLARVALSTEEFKTCGFHALAPTGTLSTELASYFLLLTGTTFEVVLMVSFGRHLGAESLKLGGNEFSKPLLESAAAFGCSGISFGVLQSQLFLDFFAQETGTLSCKASSCNSAFARKSPVLAELVRWFCSPSSGNLRICPERDLAFFVASPLDSKDPNSNRHLLRQAFEDLPSRYLPLSLPTSILSRGFLMDPLAEGQVYLSGWLLEDSPPFANLLPIGLNLDEPLSGEDLWRWMVLEFASLPRSTSLTVADRLLPLFSEENPDVSACNAAQLFFQGLSLVSQGSRQDLRRLAGQLVVVEAFRKRFPNALFALRRSDPNQPKFFVSQDRTPLVSDFLFKVLSCEPSLSAPSHVSSCLNRLRDQEAKELSPALRNQLDLVFQGIGFSETDAARLYSCFSARSETLKRDSDVVAALDDFGLLYDPERKSFLVSNSVFPLRFAFLASQHAQELKDSLEFSSQRVPSSDYPSSPLLGNHAFNSKSQAPKLQNRPSFSHSETIDDSETEPPSPEPFGAESPRELAEQAESLLSSDFHDTVLISRSNDLRGLCE